ncbi:DUF4065 domain-containing protein [Bacillus licheniformis]|uniref:type II toxin-antitoxin system antitoxin SocA domain-containing protein n=1 Tax=Bacillus licheniformis TaxID=1402 RepID=UPI002E1F192E|nr:DUF4065 domain-containing protein [Bacillus licheniformis]
MEIKLTVSSEMNKMELKNLLVYLLKHSSKALTRTELMKYVYVFEYYYTQKFGEQYTDLKFERYKYGPNHMDVVETTHELSTEGIINIHAYENYYGRTSYEHEYIGTHCDQYALDEKAEDVASFVLDLLGKENYSGVLKIAYETPPMKEIIEEENSIGCKFYGRVIDMSKSKPIYKSSRQARLEAKKRLELREETRGSDQEYYSHLLSQYHNFDDTRRRANSVKA